MGVANVLLLLFLLLAINLYVSLDLGSVKKRTKSFKAAGSPSWNEEFKL